MATRLSATDGVYTVTITGSIVEPASGNVFKTITGTPLSIIVFDPSVTFITTSPVDDVLYYLGGPALTVTLPSYYSSKNYLSL